MKRRIPAIERDPGLLAPGLLGRNAEIEEFELGRVGIVLVFDWIHMHHLVLAICYFPNHGQEVPTLELPLTSSRGRDNDKSSTADGQLNILILTVDCSIDR